MKKLESELYKFIPNAMPFNYRIAIWEYIIQVDYRLGWPDYVGVEAPFSKSYYLSHIARRDKRDRHGKTRFDYFEDKGIPSKFIKEYHDLIGDRQPSHCAVNLVFNGQQFWPHTHVEQETVVYYANCEWHNKWGGETIIYEDDGQTFHAAVPYMPGAVLWLAKGVTHAIRPPSPDAPMYRYTIGIFYD